MSQRKNTTGREMTAAPAVNLFDISEILSGDDQLTILTHEPHPCTCGRMSAIFINRNGRTVCAICDEGQQ